jgi:hemerythrin-like domain-containing protein
MKPTDILKSEHRVIEQVLHCLEQIADEGRAQGRVEAEPARDAIAFLRNFADRCHHGKEENHLFPALEAAGFPRHGGPVGVMLHEHDLGRQHIGQMDAALEPATTGQAATVEQFWAHAHGCVDLLRQHIAKEDQILFALADRVFSPEDQAALLEAFGHVEAEEMGEGTHQRFLDVANRLAERYGVAKPALAAGGACFSCGHHH